MNFEERIITVLRETGMMDDRNLHQSVRLTFATTEPLGKILEKSSASIDTTGCLLNLFSLIFGVIVLPGVKKNDMTEINQRYISLSGDRIYFSEIPYGKFSGRSKYFRFHEISAFKIDEELTEKCTIKLKTDNIIEFNAPKDHIATITQIISAYQTASVYNDATMEEKPLSIYDIEVKNEAEAAEEAEENKSRRIGSWF